MRPLVVAHRGSSVNEPENTLRAFRRALAVRTDAIELDVQSTSDGVPVVFHDADAGRLTGIQGRISQLTWRDVKKLRVGGTEPIPRLVDVLRLVGRRVQIQIELKRGVNVGRVVAAIRSARAVRRVILASFELPLVEKARRLAPGVPRMLISTGRVSRRTLEGQMRRGAAIGVSLDHRAVRNRAWVATFQAHGFSVWAWTVNRPATMRRLYRAGIDGIISDNPALLRQVIRLSSGRFQNVRRRTNRDDHSARPSLR